MELFLLAIGGISILTTMSLCRAASRADNLEENMKNREYQTSLKK